MQCTLMLAPVSPQFSLGTLLYTPQKQIRRSGNYIDKIFFSTNASTEIETQDHAEHPDVSLSVTSAQRCYSALYSPWKSITWSENQTNKIFPPNTTEITHLGPCKVPLCQSQCHFSSALLCTLPYTPWKLILRSENQIDKIFFSQCLHRDRHRGIHCTLMSAPLSPRSSLATLRFTRGSRYHGLKTRQTR